MKWRRFFNLLLQDFYLFLTKKYLIQLKWLGEEKIIVLQNLGQNVKLYRLSHKKLDAEFAYFKQREKCGTDLNQIYNCHIFKKYFFPFIIF